jgi:cytochrome c
MMTNSMAASPAKGWLSLYRIVDAVVPVLVTLGMLTLLGAAPAPAWASEALARQRNCLNCHGIDRKIVGPGFRQVAARYAGNQGAPAYLADKIVKGGAGAWGPVAMTANPQVSQEEAARLAAWVLTLK